MRIANECPGTFDRVNLWSTWYANVDTGQSTPPRRSTQAIPNYSPFISARARRHERLAFNNERPGLLHSVSW
jgi:hypothetical protein